MSKCLKPLPLTILLLPLWVAHPALALPASSTAACTALASGKNSTAICAGNNVKVNIVNKTTNNYQTNDKQVEKIVKALFKQQQIATDKKFDNLKSQEQQNQQQFLQQMQPLVEALVQDALSRAQIPTASPASINAVTQLEQGNAEPAIMQLRQLEAQALAPSSAQKAEAAKYAKQEGALFAYSGKIQEAILAFERALSYQPEDLVALDALVPLYLARSEVAQANTYAQRFHALTLSHIKEQPSNPQCLRDLSVSYNKVADILQRSDPASALQNYQASLDIRKKLSAQVPSNTQYLRDLSISYNKVADILKRSDPARALQNYQASLDIRKKLSAQEPSNVEYLHDLSVSYERVADILQRSDPARALQNYQASLDIFKKLSAQEPSNTEYLRDLSISYNKVADILKRSDPARALQNYQASLDIRKKLSAQEPSNTNYLRDLSVSYNKVADILQRSDPARALNHYQASLDIAKKLSAQEPSNIEYQTDLVSSYVKLAGLVDTKLISIAQARTWLYKALNIAKKLEKAQLLDAQQRVWPKDLQDKIDALPTK